MVSFSISLNIHWDFKGNFRLKEVGHIGMRYEEHDIQPLKPSRQTHRSKD